MDSSGVDFRIRLVLAGPAGVDLRNRQVCLQGFGYKFLDECDPPLANREEVDLAGNAFNGGVCLAVMLAFVLSADWSSILDQMENVKARKIPNMEKGLQSAKDLSSVDEEGGEGDGDNIGSEEDLWSDETLSPLF